MSVSANGLMVPAKQQDFHNSRPKTKVQVMSAKLKICDNLADL